MSFNKIDSHVQAIYNLTPLQQGMLYQKIYDESAPVNILQYTLRIGGALDENRARDALRLVTAKHDALRTLILHRKVEKPRQVVLRERDPELSAIDLRREPDAEASLQHLLEDDLARGFDLERDPLLRLALVRINDKESLIIWSMHHIIVDGWCITILSDDFVSFYHELSAGQAYDDLHAMIRLRGRRQTSYEDYVKWIDSQPDDAAAYWRSLLEGYDEPALVMPTRRGTTGSGLARVLVPAELETRIKTLASGLNITVNAILETAWGIALQRSSYTYDAVFGKAVSGRDAGIAGLDGVVGLFVNTIPVRVTTDETDTVEDLLRKTHEQALASARQSPRSLAEIQQQSSLGSALVQVLFVYENHIQLDTEKLTLLGMDVTEHTVYEHTGYPLALKVWHDNNMNLDVAYSEVYGAQEMERLAARLIDLLDQMTRTPSRHVKALDFITDSERALILGAFNNTAAPWPEDKVYSQLFEEQVKAHPDKTAVCFHNDVITYAELSRRVNSVANKLRPLGLGADDIVAIISRRDPSLLAGILGVLKAGGAFLPIERDLPEARIRFMLEDSKAKALLTTDPALSWPDLPIINIDPQLTDSEAICQLPDSSSPVNCPTNLAYCIYTSGTTGLPKGVLIEQRNLVCLCTSPAIFSPVAKATLQTTILSVSPYCFDAFVIEALLPLAHGWTVALADEDERWEQSTFLQFVEKYPGAFLMLTPSHLRMHMTTAENSTCLSHLSLLAFVGEPVPPNQYKDMRRCTDAPIYNMYGPTESTVWASGGELGADIDIGPPAPNRQIYILNGTTLCGIGTPGELCVAGPGLGRGYLNRPALTATYFVTNPFGPGKLYRTGDLARWTSDGRIEYMGRIDQQVKIRGNRVELSEIENALRQQPGISDATVILAGSSEDGNAELWGYVVTNNTSGTSNKDSTTSTNAFHDAGNIDDADDADDVTGASGNCRTENTVNLLQIKTALAQRLPDYMIPSRLKIIDRIPLNANGKTDKKALPVIAAMDTDDTLAAPKDEEEIMVTQAFQKALDLAKPIGISENFFDLGGHSLRAARAIYILEALSGIRLSLKVWFASPTVEGIAAALRDAKNTAQTEQNAGFPAGTLPFATPKKSYPMSPTQRRLFAVCQLDDIGIAYNIPAALSFSGTIDTQRLQTALNTLSQRHDALRTSFRLIQPKHTDNHTGGYLENNTRDYSEEPAQVIATADEVVVKLETRTLQTQDTPQKLLEAFVRPFDLSQAPLMRVKAVTGQERSLLLIDIHHIIADGATVALLFDELAALYNGKTLPEPGHQYKDWSEWARLQDFSGQQAYWETTFAAEAPILNIPTDFPRPKQQGFTGGHAFLHIPKDMRRAVETLALAHGATPFMVLLTALMALLSKYTGEEDITIGSPVSGRTHPDCERIAGMFVNTIALRGYPQQYKPFARLLDEVKQTCLQAFENQDFPFESLVDIVPWVQRDFSRNPLFDVMFALQNNEPPHAAFNDLTYLGADSNTTPARFDLTINVEEDGGTYKTSLLYSAALFRPETAARLLRHYITLLNTAISNPSCTIGALPLMDATEYKQVVYEFSNAPDRADTLQPKNKRTIDNKQWAMGVSDKTIVSLFADQVALRHDHPALVLSNQQISYGELDRITTTLAQNLLAIGIKAEDLVAVYSGRGFGYVVGALGAMKAGAAFLPIDESTPSERTRFILEDSGVKALLLADADLPLTTDLPTFDLPATSPELRALDFEYQPNPYPLPDLRPDNLAFCIHTSGTTGVPKGILLEHRGLANLTDFFRTTLKITPADTILQFASCAFDASIWEITMALTLGATLRLLPRGAAQDPDALRENLSHCTVALLPPQLVPAIKPQGLRVLQTAGSAASPETVHLAEAANGQYINAYGPTEASICATAWFHTPGDDIPVNVPIGKPISGVQVYILAMDKADILQPVDQWTMDNDKRDTTSSLCGIGVPGELCIGGAGVGRGYLNRPELTAEKFIKNPFTPSEADLTFEGDPAHCQVLYRTGDIARWLPDGNIEYLGRLDDQVKLRGFRVELGEVEAALRRQPGVQDAAVVHSDTDDAQTLSGYVAAAEDFDVAVLRESLLRELPEYMVPDQLMRLTSLPTNTSGKVNKKALPVIEASPHTGHGEAPHGEKEIRTARIFEDILGVEHVGADGDFFRLGGDSIKAIRMISRFREAGYEITVREIMTLRSVRHIALSLQLSTPKDPSLGVGGLEYNQESLSGEVLLAPIQRTFFAQDYLRPQHFNQAIFLYAREDLDERALRGALSAITLHHDMLRAIYPDGAQIILPPERSPLFALAVHDLRGSPVSPDHIENTNTEQQANIDLTKGPLLRAVLYRTDDGSHLLLCAHHLVVDGVSWRILTEDLFSAYRQAQTASQTPLLPVKTASFRDWTTLLAEFADSGALEAQQAYWAKTLEEAIRWDIRTQVAHPAITRAPASRSEAAPKAVSYNQAEIRAGHHITNALLYDVGTVLDAEINDILLSALALAVRRWSGRQKISVELEGHGREQLHRPLDIDRTVGWFTCCYPVVLEAQDNPGETVRTTRNILQGVPHRGISYALLAEGNAFGAERFHPGLSFNYLGHADSEQSRYTGTVTPSPLPPGRMIAAENRLPNALSINGAVSKGELVLNVQYETTTWDQTDILNFCAAYEQALADIVEYCGASDTWTGKERFSDEGDLSDEEFEEIQSLFQSPES